MSRWTKSAAALALAVGVTGAISGCTTPDTAASVDGEKVTVEQVQNVVKSIKAEQPQGQVEPGAVIPLLLFAPEIQKMARAEGEATSEAAARQSFTNTEPNDDAVKAMQVSMDLQSLGQSDAAKKMMQRLLDKDVKVNPRYGTWVKGEGLGPTETDWLKAPAKPALG